MQTIDLCKNAKRQYLMIPLKQETRSRGFLLDYLETATFLFFISKNF